VLGGEEIAPISSIRGGEEVILDYNSDEEPENDFAASEGAVEGRDAAGGLAVVGWEAKVEG
jgi:hypothetical protein